jgi:hypothetical protein
MIGINDDSPSPFFSSLFLFENFVGDRRAHPVLAIGESAPAQNTGYRSLSSPSAFKKNADENARYAYGLPRLLFDPFRWWVMNVVAFGSPHGGAPQKYGI